MLFLFGVPFVRNVAVVKDVEDFSGSGTDDLRFPVFPP